ncbi:hypothetical protein N7462_003229 [Penicillium macrosclerotiorum]|uniref:uncharacterized protein n=1 Tax=Penicillium macrosclerotiorum TaxID=303699 RepID=UPI0025478B69|nr:uncharacterized protein N7462_003229 [Penicillium macrosclerotiorum]KAJ5688837.1 hypothetical protein N7462_003229 [Penicillium macrosclerotiorum]
MTSSPSLGTHHDRSDREPLQQSQYFPAREPGGKVPYVGDSSNLNYLIQQFGNPFEGTSDAPPLQDRLQGAMLARMGSSTAQEIERFHASTKENLVNQGAFDLPSQETSKALLDAYFNYSLAALPILDKSRFLVSLTDGTFSHLLLNAVYIAATTYCADSVIADGGFASRYSASLTFYRRAKLLYDAGYETDAIKMIQATFLMCHWWSGLLEHKDPWYWLGISAGIAQALGMNQAKSYLHLEEKDRKIWRRLWWMVYAMDINLSMLLDRPPHVQGRLCNVDTLSETDFEGLDENIESEKVGQTLSEANMFAVNAVQLARTVDRYFTIKLDQGTGHSQDICLEQISLWWSSLSPTFRSLSTKSSTWAVLTEILYQEYRLLLHRSNPRFSQNIGSDTPTFEICTAISHLLEIIMTNDLVYAAAASIIAPVLSVLSIYIANIHRGDSGIRLISEHRAHFCMAILDKLQDRLPVVGAFFPIYEALLSRKRGRDSSKDLPTGSPILHSRPQAETRSSLANLGPAGGLFDQILQDNTNASFSFSLPFGSLFEDIFMGSPSQPTSFNEDETSCSYKYP